MKKRMTTTIAKFPVDMVHQMNRLPDVDWVDILASAVKDKLEALADALAKKSKLTRRDAAKFSDMITRKAAQKFLG